MQYTRNKIKSNSPDRSTIKVATNYKNNLKRLSIDRKKTISELTEMALAKVYGFEPLTTNNN